MRIALHWDASLLGSQYGHRANGLAFASLLALPHWHESTNVFVGDLLLGREAQEIARYARISSTDPMTWLTDKWSSCELGQWVQLKLQRFREVAASGVWVTAFDTVSPRRAPDLHRSLHSCEAYLGMLEPSEENIVQAHFFASLLPYGRIVGRKFRVFPHLADLGNDDLSDLELVREYGLFDSVSFEDICKVPGFDELADLQYKTWLEDNRAAE
jgi:hypothetical protein